MIFAKRIGVALCAGILPSLAFGAEMNLVEGGAAVVVTLGLSILFLAVTIERFLHLRVRAVVPSDLPIADRKGNRFGQHEQR